MIDGFNYDCEKCDQKIIKSDGLHCRLDPDDLNPLCPRIVVYGEKEKDHGKNKNRMVR